MDLESISSLSLRLCFQPQRYETPDRVNSGQGFVVRRGDPRINRGKLGGVPSLADLNTFSCWAGPRLFFGTTLVFAINRGSTEASGGKVRTSAPGSNPSHKGP